jgi:hypothetical protein
VEELLLLISTSEHPGDSQALAESLCEGDTGYRAVMRALGPKLRVRAARWVVLIFCWVERAVSSGLCLWRGYSCYRGLLTARQGSRCLAGDNKCLSTWLFLLLHAYSGKGRPLASCRLKACSPGQPVADWGRQRELLEEVSSRGPAGGSAAPACHTMPSLSG